MGLFRSGLFGSGLFGYRRICYLALGYFVRVRVSVRVRAIWLWAIWSCLGSTLRAIRALAIGFWLWGISLRRGLGLVVEAMSSQDVWQTKKNIQPYQLYCSFPWYMIPFLAFCISK